MYITQPQAINSDRHWYSFKGESMCMQKYTVSEKDLPFFYFFFLGAQCVESGVSCTDCY